MVQPINFTTAVQNPVARTLQGYLQGAQIYDRYREQKEQKEREQQKARDFKMLISKDSVTPQEIASMIYKYPELKENVEAFTQNLSADKKKSGVGRMSKVYASLLGKRPDSAAQFLESEALAAENSGNEQKAQSFRDLAGAINQDPRAAEIEIATRLSAIMGPDKFLETFTKLEDARVSRDPEAQAQSDSPFQFGRETLYEDEKGNKYYGTLLKDPNKGEGRSLLTPLPGSPEKPVGKLNVTGSYGETAQERSERVAREAAEKERRTLEVQQERLPTLKAKIKEAEQKAASEGQEFDELAQMEAALPDLIEVTDELKELAPIATYTKGGRLWDAAVRELGFGATEGASARAKYIALIRNQVLPLLKPTFGGSFTAAEGDKLEATLGDPNLSPEEKIAQIEAFIEQKARDIRTKKRKAQIKSSRVSNEEFRAMFDQLPPAEKAKVMRALTPEEKQKYFGR